MEKKNKILLISLVVLTLLVVGGCIYAIMHNNNKNKDAIKFKNEYSEYNGQTTPYGMEYVNVSIDDDNTVKYVTEEKAIKLLKEGRGVIYFGFSTCPWCRSLVSTLTDVAEDKNETIYYLDILDIRSTFKIENSKLNKTKDGSKGYYELLKLLDNELEEYYLTDEAGNEYDTNEKRLYAPTLVAFNKGKITSIHVGTVESQKSGFDELTEEQVDELEEIIEKLINSKNIEACTSDKC